MKQLSWARKLTCMLILMLFLSGCLFPGLFLDLDPDPGIEPDPDPDPGPEPEPEPEPDNAIAITEFGVKSDVQICQADAINRAIDQVSRTQGGGTLYFPPGKYYIGPNKQLNVRPNVNLIGAGMGKSVIWGDNDGRYLVSSSRTALHVRISKLTFDNPGRLLLMQNVSDITFVEVEFKSGFIRFENGSKITIDHSLFQNNLGKAAYASDVCSEVTLTNNRVINPAEGGFNLSRHQNSYVANNYIYSDTNIDSGYAGIRLPNNAYNNTVVNNEIHRTGRGIFVLSGSENNVIENNKIYRSTYQGAFIESSYNTFRGNYIEDAGDESIYVNGANHNVIEDNQIVDTYLKSDRVPRRNVALKIYGLNNIVCNNTVSRTYGRRFKDISSGNIDEGNVYQ